MAFNSTSSTIDKRKFFKLFEITGIFKQTMMPVNTTKNETVFTGEINTSIFNNNYNKYGVSNVDENTIFFITASETDEGKFIKCKYRLNSNDTEISWGGGSITVPIIPGISTTSSNKGRSSDSLGVTNNTGTQSGSLAITNPGNTQTYSYEYKYIKINKGDTLLWVKGDFYSLSKNGIVNVIKEDDVLRVVYSNGTIENIALSEINGDYKSAYPIKISKDGTISLEDISINKSTRNYVEFPNVNEVQNGVLGAHVQGYGNIAFGDYQTIIGKYAEQSNNSLFIIGNGASETNRKTVLSVSKDGITYSEKDVIAQNTYKLSDMHSVKNEDWAFINTSSNTGGFSSSFSTSFDLSEFE
jgi:hypothetical protein